MNNTNSKVLSMADLYELKENNVILAQNGANSTMHWVKFQSQKDQTEHSINV